MKGIKLVIGFLMLWVTSISLAENATVFEISVDKPISDVYGNMQASFDDSRFFIVKELNIGQSLSNFSEKWGDDYNQNNLSAIRSLVFCKRLVC